MGAVTCAMDPRNCLNCSNIFSPRRTSNIYCCRSCQTHHLRTLGKIVPKPKQGVVCQCLYCKESFYVPTYRSKSAKYCSRKCSALHKPEIGQRARENSPITRRSRALKAQGSAPKKYKTIAVGGKQVREHRWAMEQHLGRKLESWEHVHHKDGNHLNNALENLEVLSNADHQRKELSEW